MVKQTKCIVMIYSNTLSKPRILLVYGSTNLHKYAESANTKHLKYF